VTPAAEDALSEPELAQAIRGAHLLGIRSRTQVTARVLEAADKHFVTDRIEGSATATWSAAVPSKNFTFTSDPAATSTSVFAEIGAERNGVFFR